jgi:gentisate 1,2-dioxygenase
MTRLRPEDHEKLAMELVTFAKDELQRRKKAPILITKEDIDTQLKDARFPVHMVDPRIGSNQKTFRFWKHKYNSGADAQWKTLGHRHTVEGIIYVETGQGYSVIDGIEYHWKPGDLICVPLFAWHRHVVTSTEQMIYLAATTGPLSMYLGLAVYEDERFPEHWIFADKGDESLKTLIPGKTGAPEGSTKVVLGTEAAAMSKADRLYVDALNYAPREEERRRAGRVHVRSDGLIFEPTRIGRIAPAIEPATGFHVQTIGTLFAEIPPGKKSGAHRHSYEETEYVISGNGYTIVEDQRIEWKEGDTLCIPVFSWHQHFNTGKQTARFMVHHNRPYMQNMGFLMVEHGENADL